MNIIETKDEMFIL